MKKSIITIFLCLSFFVPCHNAAGILLNLTEKDIEDAIKQGEKQGYNVAEYLEKNYRFGEKDLFEENGIIRTKWNKLVVLSGLLSAGGKRISDQEKERITKSVDLQIDIHTFGNRIDFASAYKVYLVQKGKNIEPEKISANHVAYLPEKRVATSGFSKYRATVRSYFPYDTIGLNEKAEIVLVKNKKKVVFEVNFKEYK
ncbi:MAG: hypothetical protein GQ554_08320 [Deltaproteobacteria bacterium]|nr:hypothetical protein [Deltaproteobacteria bacterium]NOQ86869.1 hypothetical protein [Deltaproteobacteria bacterium]